MFAFDAFERDAPSYKIKRKDEHYVVATDFESRHTIWFIETYLEKASVLKLISKNHIQAEWNLKQLQNLTFL